MEKGKLYPKQLEATPETLSWEPLKDSAQSQYMAWYRYASKWMSVQLPSWRIKCMYHFGWDPCMCDRKHTLLNPFCPVYMLLFCSFCPSVLILPVAKIVLIPEWWQEPSVSLMKYISLIDSFSILVWKAGHDCKSISLSMSHKDFHTNWPLPFACPEKTALPKHPWRKGKEAGLWAGWDSKRLTTRIRQMLLLTIWLSHLNGQTDPESRDTTS